MSRWQALLSGQVEPGIYHLPAHTRPEAVRQALEPAGWRVFAFDGKRISDKASYLTEVARAMNFPDYFGKNWDALQDSLTDLGWAPARGYVILYPHADRFAKSPDWRTAWSILLTAVARWQQAGTPMYILLGGMDESLPQLSTFK